MLLWILSELVDKIVSVYGAHTADSGHWFGYLTTIEAQDIYDLVDTNFTANAKVNFTLSFYVKSSVTGTWELQM